MSTNLEQQAAELIPGDVRMLSGCQDSQTSADVSHMGSFQLPSDVGLAGAGGACSGAFTSVVTSAAGTLTWSVLLNNMRTILVNKRFTQIPQLSSSRKLGLEGTFGLVPPGCRARRAVFIGINYVGASSGELRGCHNDADMIKKVVQQKLGFASAETRMLKDDGKSEQPTHDNILNAFSWLVDDAKPGDCLFMHYSGHGGWTNDHSGDEHDGRDETIVPVDYERAGQILDDDIYKRLVLAVPNGVTLTVIMDCCHSGSVFDLPFYFLQTEETDANAPPPVMQVNPQFDWKKILNLGMKLYQMHQSGASFSQIRSAAMTEINNDPNMKQALMSASTTAVKLIAGGGGSSSGNGTTAASEQNSKSASKSNSIGDMAKFGASLLMAANEAGSQKSAAKGFASFASKFF